MVDLLFDFAYSDTGMFVISLLRATLRMSIPLGFAALGAMYSERVGVVNIGLEGLMLFGAFFGVVGSFYTGSAVLGVLTGIFGAAVCGFLFAVFTVRFKADHIVSGVAVNLLGLGLTTVWLSAIWGNRGKSDDVARIEFWSWNAVRDWPIIGDLFGRQTPFLYLLVGLVILSWVFLFRTRWGLHVRGIGEHPHAADSLGIAVEKYQMVFVTLSGALAGLGGAYLSLGDLAHFGRDMTAGRGFIALAANILGNWNPIGGFLASLLFGFANALQMRIQGFGIPSQFTQMLPYVLTIVVLAGVVKKVRAPAAAGKAFERGEV